MTTSSPNRWWRPTLRGLRLLLVVYVLLFFLLVLFQDRLIYKPQVFDVEHLITNSKHLGLLEWRDAQDQLIGWHAKPRHGAASQRCLILHGNAGHALARYPYVEAIQALSHPADWEIFVLEYPGYGSRPGTPSETAFVEAAVSALDILKKNDARPVFILGESLGSAVAAQTAAMRPDAVSGLLLITPFDSLRSIARSHFPAFPLWPFIRDRYDSIGALRSYDGPVVVLVAGKDEVVPPRLGRNLYESYHGPKKLLEQEAGHNTLDLSPLSGWWQEAFQFLKEQSVVTRM